MNNSNQQTPDCAKNSCKNESRVAIIDLLRPSGMISIHPVTVIQWQSPMAQYIHFLLSLSSQDMIVTLNRGQQRSLVDWSSHSRDINISIKN